jgi:hypothetical protein
MSNKTKKNVKVRDLNPKKDAKGGGIGHPSPTGGGTSVSGKGSPAPLGGGTSVSSTGPSTH